MSAGAREVVGTITHFVDLTSRRMLEEYKTQSERLVSLGMMAGGMAHEINNPLTVIVGWLEHCIDNHRHTKPVEEALRKCLHAGIRCGELVSAMLSLSRRTTTKVTRIDLHALLRRVGGLVEKQLALHHVECISQFTATHPSIAGDERELEQLFLNLILNARDAMPHGGKLFVTTQNESDELVVRVVDTGVGVPKERLPHLFTPFYTTKEVGKGTGLGLAICQAIVDRHRGRIEASSEMGRGTTITVQLPMMLTTTLEAAPAPQGPLPELAPMRITVVDDDISVLELCQEALGRWGHQVKAFNAPVECLEWIRSNAPDLVILDVKMPTMDGVELYYKIQECRPGLKTLFVTGSVVGRSLEAIPRSGMGPVKVLHKPFRMEQLYRAVASICLPPEANRTGPTPAPQD
ncbi:MAG: response regulator [Candidatus Riflebacteria bacterium]|nr:response regulator [Candidatus Riflebacteria bacterium]